ncbi:uracil-DNA glycosylase, family 4 [Oligella urethralis]|uniref:uracil-DNA glycosylase family protein n=1 Tax=Oligella urethralis TaxID=90245 RepID=UPI000E01E9FB|nr:uracil-DNA glycosylase family protein [Oligella urethralis]SUA60728.1 uracil-DNA glycosylase, family 4 [Oligella urethralis]
MIADSLNPIQQQLLIELGINYLWGRSLAPNLQRVPTQSVPKSSAQALAAADVGVDTVQVATQAAEAASAESAQAAAETARKMLQRARHRLPEVAKSSPVVATPAVASARTASEGATQAQAAVSSAALSLHELSWQALVSYAAECYGSALSEASRAAIFSAEAQEPKADWLFIEQLPSTSSYHQAEAVSVDADRLFEAMLSALALQRHEVQRLPLLLYDAVHEPRTGKDPTSALSLIFIEQLKRIRPRCIVAFGDAAAALLAVDSGLLALRRQELVFEHPALGSIPVVATFSPQYLLLHSSEKAQSWQDLKRARRLIRARGECQSAF